MASIVIKRILLVLETIVFFALSFIITGVFIEQSNMYVSQQQQILSFSIAGGKWAIQIIAAFILLKEKKWQFTRLIGLVCFAGSFILLPYCLIGGPGPGEKDHFFLISLIVSVAAMIFFFYRATRLSSVSIRWWFAWLICLAIAVSLQVFFVFEVIDF
jgi:hypothetical protein